MSTERPGARESSRPVETRTSHVPNNVGGDTECDRNGSLGSSRLTLVVGLLIVLGCTGLQRFEARANPGYFVRVKVETANLRYGPHRECGAHSVRP